jgi:hypothetical protein
MSVLLIILVIKWKDMCGLFIFIKKWMDQ